MLEEHIRQRRHAARIAQLVTMIPEYPIYREANGKYIIYVDGQATVFDDEAAASAGRLAAREAWLRKHISMS